MSPIELLLSKLTSAKKAGKGWSACCPAHEDLRASLSVSESDDGTALVKCHAGCETATILAAMGLKLADLFVAKPSASPHRNGKPRSCGKTYTTAAAAVEELERQQGKRSALWTYHDEGGNPVGLVVRWNLPDGKKDIRPISLLADGWRIGAMPEPRPLYRLPEVMKAIRVVVVEGEKAADAAVSIGMTATTSAGGSQAATKSDWRPLAGKEVWILPDNDLPGRKYADTVAGILVKLTPAPVVRILELPGLPEGGDIVDWIDAHGDAAEPDGMRQEIEALASTVEEEATNPTTRDVDRFRPFPVDSLPEPIRSFTTAAAKAIGCDPSYVALPLLVAIASAIGHTQRLELKRGWTVPAILWGAIVGESGTAKSPPFKLVIRPVRERQRKALDRHNESMEEHEAELSRWEKQLATWKRSKLSTDDPPAKPEAPQAERYIVQDTTVEALAPILLANPRGLLLACDELAGWVGSFDRYAGKGKAGADVAKWLSMFNGESILVDRKTGSPRTIYVPHAALCVTGGIQPGILRRAFSAEHRESGLLARLLLTSPPRKAKRWTEADIDPKREVELARLFDRLYDLKSYESETGETRPVLLRLDENAKRSWIGYYNAHAGEQVDLDGDLAAAWSKLEEYAARLALVVHFIRWATCDPTLTAGDTLDDASMTAGITLAKWFKNEARRVYAMLGESDTERDSRRLVEWIDRKGGTVTAREVQQGCRWLKEPGEAEAALEALVKAGRGSWMNPGATERGGRPSRLFRLSRPSTSTKPENPAGKRGFVDVDTVDAAKSTFDSDRKTGQFFRNEKGLPD